MKTYEYSDGFRSPVDPATAGAELVRMADNGDISSLPADAVVEAAKPIGSPLHDHFEWDDGTAAHEFRLTQARALVRNIRVVINKDTPKERKIRVFVHSRERGGYVPTVRMRTDSELAAEVIGQAIGYVRSARERLADLRVATGTRGYATKLAEIEAGLKREQKRLADKK